MLTWIRTTSGTLFWAGRCSLVSAVRLLWINTEHWRRNRASTKLCQLLLHYELLHLELLELLLLIGNKVAHGVHLILLGSHVFHYYLRHHRVTHLRHCHRVHHWLHLHLVHHWHHWDPTLNLLLNRSNGSWLFLGLFGNFFDFFLLSGGCFCRLLDMLHLSCNYNWFLNNNLSFNFDSSIRRTGVFFEFFYSVNLLLLGLTRFALFLLLVVALEIWLLIGLSSWCCNWCCNWGSCLNFFNNDFDFRFSVVDVKGGVVFLQKFGFSSFSASLNSIFVLLFLDQSFGILY